MKNIILSILQTHNNSFIKGRSNSYIPIAFAAVRRTGNCWFFVKQEIATLKSGRKSWVDLAAMISENLETHQRDLATRIGIELEAWMSEIRFYISWEISNEDVFLYWKSITSSEKLPNSNKPTSLFFQACWGNEQSKLEDRTNSISFSFVKSNC